MEKSNRVVAQVYGYAVCLVAVITFLIAITGLVTAISDLGDPIHAGFNQPGSPSLASFENYKLDVIRSSQKGNETSTPSYVPTEQTLRAMYEAAKDDKIQSSRHQSTKSILNCSLLIGICLVLFFTHWSWMKKMAKTV